MSDGSLRRVWGGGGRGGALCRESEAGGQLAPLPCSKPTRFMTFTLLPWQGLVPAHSGDFGEPLTLLNIWFLHLKNKGVRLDQVLFSKLF